MKSTTIASHQDVRNARAQAAFLALRGAEDHERRRLEIKSLETSAWRGHTVYAIRCNGTTGKGPHTVNVPEALLWSLISFEAYRCPFHA